MIDRQQDKAPTYDTAQNCVLQLQQSFLLYSL